MSWFGEQIQTRIYRDREQVSDALLQVADSIDGKDRYHAKKRNLDQVREEVQRICQYYKINVPHDTAPASTIIEIIDSLTHFSGIMYRRVTLNETWWKNGYGPLLAIRKDNGEACALLPGKISGYRWHDHISGKTQKVTAATADMFEERAVCFYRPLPQKSMDAKDLFLFLYSNMSFGDRLLASGSLLFMTIVGLITPVITNVVFSQIIPSGNTLLIASAAVLLIAAAFSVYLASSVRTAVVSRVKNQMDSTLENAVLGRLLQLPVKFFSGKSAGELATSVKALAVIPEVFTEIYFVVVRCVFLPLIYIAQIFLIAREFTIPAIIAYVLSMLILFVSVSQKMVLARKNLEAEADTQGLVYALFSGIQKIKLSGSENRVFAKWAEKYRKKAANTYRVPFPAVMQGELIVIVQMIGMLAAFIFGTKSSSAATFASFSVSYGVIISLVMQTSSRAGILAYLKPSLDLGMPILREKPEVSEQRVPVKKISGGLELNNVSFRYASDMPKVLDNISLRIRPGEYVAIAGKSGCGKSTLMRIMLGFEVPDEGAVYYDDKDLQRIDLSSLRRNIGSVMQQGSLFTGDIYSNITISAPWLGLDEAWEAAEMAGIKKDIEEMPMGMHTWISEGDGGVSGGQKQRLMIARAIAPKPKILMFDEATSALDNLTQKIISDSLASLKCTRIVIAHRLSTIKNCNRIIVLDEGRIAEEGTYDELIRKGGLFAELVERQQIDGHGNL
ncbi:MAG: ATP-binding cassette domain-containing protein [Eubacterium sp.]|nr:ATP-binding cassette domain-containing protein [Eubacterium sp.]